MKKYATLLVLCLTMMLVVIGCGKNKSENSSDSDITPTPAVSGEENKDNEDDQADGDSSTNVPSENPIVKEEYDINDYIKLGQYKGIEVKLEKSEITGEDVEAAIQMELFDSGITPVEVTDRPVRLGDTVNIDFVGYLNGEAFEGGAAEGYDLTIGSGAFINGFEDQLIGAKLNQELDINVVFPVNYSNTQLAGQPATFKVKINKIQYIDLTDDVAKSMGFENVEEYRKTVFQELVSENEENLLNQKRNYIYNTVVKGSEIKLPDNLIEYYAYEFKTLYTNIVSSYGIDLETYLSFYGYSMEDFERDALSYSELMATKELVVKAISTIEGIEVTDDEFQAKAVEMAKEYGYESTEEFLNEADVKYLKNEMLIDKVMDFLVAESVEI